jgi:hypothetical protein
MYTTVPDSLRGRTIMRVRVFLLTVLGTVATCLCLAASSDGRTKSLSGVYAIGTTNVDPGPKDSRDSHFIVYLQGTTAKDLYDSMKVTPRGEGCGSDGDLVKTIGGMSCSFTPESKAYVCNFAIDIAKQKIERLPC